MTNPIEESGLNCQSRRSKTKRCVYLTEHKRDPVCLMNKQHGTLTEIARMMEKTNQQSAVKLTEIQAEKMIIVPNGLKILPK